MANPPQPQHQRPRNRDGTFAKVSVADRFWQSVSKTDTCWLWMGSKHQDGYGRFWNGIRRVPSHRWAYEQVHGPIPNGLQIDHLCRVRHCVNPAHLEVVTGQQNFRRGSHPNVRLHHAGHCKHGHPFTKANTYIKKNGTRFCRACNRNRQAKYRLAMKQGGVR